MLGCSRHFGVEIAHRTNACVVHGQASAESQRATVMERRRLATRADETRRSQVLAEPLELPIVCGPTTPRRWARGPRTLPSEKGLRSVRRMISEYMQAWRGVLDEGTAMEQLNRAVLGWAT